MHYLTVKSTAFKTDTWLRTVHGTSRSNMICRKRKMDASELTAKMALSLLLFPPLLSQFVVSRASAAMDCLSLELCCCVGPKLTLPQGGKTLRKSSAPVNAVGRALAPPADLNPVVSFNGVNGNLEDRGPEEFTLMISSKVEEEACSYENIQWHEGIRSIIIKEANEKYVSQVLKSARNCSTVAHFAIDLLGFTDDQRGSSLDFSSFFESSAPNIEVVGIRCFCGLPGSVANLLSALQELQLRTLCFDVPFGSIPCGILAELHRFAGLRCLEFFCDQLDAFLEQMHDLRNIESLHLRERLPLANGRKPAVDLSQFRKLRELKIKARRALVLAENNDSLWKLELCKTTSVTGDLSKVRMLGFTCCRDLSTILSSCPAVEQLCIAYPVHSKSIAVDATGLKVLLLRNVKVQEIRTLPRFICFCILRV